MLVSLASSAQPARLGAAHLIDGLVEVRGDVKAVQDVERVTDFGGDDLEVRFPHVAADKAQAIDDLRSERRQPQAQRGLSATRPHPQQTPAVAVNLVDDGQEVFRAQSFAPVNLVDADGLDPFQLAMGQAPLEQTNPPSGKRPPNWFGRPGPFRATTTGVPSGPGRPSIVRVTGRLPALQGMGSTPMPCSGQFTRRGV